MSNNMPSEISPAILRGSKFTTNKAWRPSISRGFSRSFLIPARFIRYYFLTGVGAGLIEVLVKTIPTFFGHPPSDVPTIGASGAIFGIFAACAILFPDRQVSVMFLPIRMSMRSFVLLLAGLEFFLPLLLGSAGDNVSHICHLGGMLVGWVYLRRGSFLYGVRNTVTDWQHKRNRKRFEVYINKHKKEPPSRPDNWVN